MWLEIVAAVIAVSSFVYHRWIEDHPSAPNAPPAVPKVSDGVAIPLVYGRCRVRAPLLAWAGNWQRRNLVVDDTFMFFIDQVFVVGIPFYGTVAGDVTLEKVYAGDLEMTLTTVFWDSLRFDGNTKSFDDIMYDLGAQSGIQRKGSSNLQFIYGQQAGSTADGITSAFEFFEGTATQTISTFSGSPPTSYTEAIMTGQYATDVNTKGFGGSALANSNSLPIHDLPSYRNQMVCGMVGMSLGTGGGMPAIGFEVSVFSSSNPINGGSHVTDEADPAQVIYDLLTSPFGKVGLATSRVDTTSFAAASATLLAEGHGFSMAFEAIEDAKAMIDRVLRQIDGVLYFDPSLGKIALKLIRFDYSLFGLPDLNPDNCMPSSSAWYQIQGQSETYNQVRLKYSSRVDGYADGQIVAQNAANIVAQLGRIRNLDVDMPGCCTVDLAQKLASRELAAVSRPQVKLSVLANRGFYAAMPGDVMTFTWPKLAIGGMVMRVARKSLGELHSGAIQLDLVRDIFDVSIGAFGAP